MLASSSSASESASIQLLPPRELSEGNKRESFERGRRLLFTGSGEGAFKSRDGRCRVMKEGGAAS
jgi:hypothetical protein